MKWLISIVILVSIAFLSALVQANKYFPLVALAVTFSGENGNIIITSPSMYEGTFEHPSNRSALSFAVFDEQLNPVVPIGIGKADPPMQKINLKLNQVFKYSVNSYVHGQQKLFFSYVSGTGWFGYPLEKGKIYRVVAIYRPWGPGKKGIASDEMVFQF